MDGRTEAGVPRDKCCTSDEHRGKVRRPVQPTSSRILTAEDKIVRLHPLTSKARVGEKKSVFVSGDLS